MRANRSFPVLIVSSTILLAIAFMLSSVKASGNLSSKPPHHPAASDTSPETNQTHVLHAGLWRTDGGFVSSIRIKNILVVAPIQVNTVLFMADGTPYVLPSVTIPTSGVATVNINDALATAPPSVTSHLSQFGSAQLTYDYPSPGHVVASVAAIDTPRSLSFIYQVMEPMPMPDDETPKILEGLWWKRDRGVLGSVSLTNTTDQPRTATLKFTRLGEDPDSKEVQLPAHATQVFAVEQLSREEFENDNRAGGIRVQYNGPRGAILVNGSLANESEGYSANMPFWSHNLPDTPAKKITMGSAGIMVGKPDPMMMPGFPAATRFEPYLTLRNTTSEHLEVNLQVNYMMGMEGSAPVNRQLPAQPLRPFEAKQVKLRPMLDEAGLRAFNGTINLSISFTGHGGDLIVATGSVDQTGTYVFEVAPQVVGSILGKITGYWSVAKGNDAMYSLWNPSDAPQDVLATFYYGDGSGTYQVPVHLEPQASTMLDVAMLIMEKKPDPSGNTIPSNIQEGSASFASTTNQGKITVVIAGGLFNVSTATCGEICQFCDGYSNLQLIPGPFSGTIGSNWSLITQATDAYGNHQTLNGGTWSSNAPSVMTVSNGSTHAAGVGQASIMDFLQAVSVYQGQFCVSDNMNDACPTANESPVTTGTVQKPGFLQVLSNSPDTNVCLGLSTAAILKYKVLDVNKQAMNTAGMTIIESISSISGSCPTSSVTDSSTWTTDSTGTMIGTDELFVCCNGATCGISWNQTFTVNGFGVIILGQDGVTTGSTNAISVSCSGGHGSAPRIAITP